MRLLVTGASGFLGRNALLSVPPSWDVVALYHHDTTRFLRFLEARRLAHVRAYACDLTDVSSVQRTAAATGERFDACLYLASNTSIPLSIERPAEDLTTNVIGLLHTLQTWTFEHMVYLSSGAVYMGSSGHVTPNTPVSPTLPYAIAKLAAEQYIRASHQWNGSPRSATIIRFFGAFGPYEPARKVYTKLVRRFAFERDPRFVVQGNGENYIDAMYVDDTIHALIAALTQVSPGVRTIDLGLGNRETVNEVVARAAAAFGLTPDIEHVGMSPEYITFYCTLEPFQSIYNVTPTVSLEDGLRRLAEHLRQEDQRAMV